MNPFEMVVIIVLIATIGKVASNILGGTNTPSRRDKRRAERGELVVPEPGAVNAAEAARMRSEIARLNDRLAVLERIATDPAKRLSDEIDALRK